MVADPQLVDPLEASRHPFETYLLVLATVSGVPLLFGQSNSDGIEQALPTLLVHAWGGMLAVGSLLALIGLYWRGHSATGLLLERTGLIGVGGAAIIYTTAILLHVGLGGLFSGCIIGGFGLACFAQARRISQRIRAVLAQIEEIRR